MLNTSPFVVLLCANLVACALPMDVADGEKSAGGWESLARDVNVDQIPMADLPTYDGLTTDERNALRYRDIPVEVGGHALVIKKADYVEDGEATSCIVALHHRVEALARTSEFQALLTDDAVRMQSEPYAAELKAHLHWGTSARADEPGSVYRLYPDAIHLVGNVVGGACHLPTLDAIDAAIGDCRQEASRESALSASCGFGTPLLHRFKVELTPAEEGDDTSCADIEIQYHPAGQPDVWQTAGDREFVWDYSNGLFPVLLSGQQYRLIARNDAGDNVGQVEITAGVTPHVVSIPVERSQLSNTWPLSVVRDLAGCGFR